MSHATFIIPTPNALVAVPGRRNGYIQLAPRNRVTGFADLPPHVFEAGQAWARQMEAMGAQNVLLLMIAEVEPHKHLHIFPRWPQDKLKGIPLFESRENAAQPRWRDDVKSALASWGQQHGVSIIAPCGVIH
ncbi:MAG: hypothetical protein AB7P76_11415 [Candidatus Melainabacteria bacterium]